jgi:hypothetical protein
MAATNPHTLSWSNPTTNTDGSALAQTDVAGYQLALDGAAAVSVPIGYATTFDMSTLAAYEALKSGSHTATLALTNVEGNTGAASNAVTFSIAAIPGAITDLAVK